MKLLRIFLRSVNVVQGKHIFYLLSVIILLLLSLNSVSALLVLKKIPAVQEVAVLFVAPLRNGIHSVTKNIINVLYLPRMFGGVTLPHYEINVSQGDIKKIYDALPSPASLEVFKSQVMLNDDMQIRVSATVAYDDKEYKAKISVRGISLNHWVYPKKSWNVYFKDELRGAKQLKFILPDDRYYFIELLNNYRADKLGLATADMRLVTLSLNGKNQGVYYEIEDWDNVLLEKDQFPADVSLYKGTSAYSGENGEPQFENILNWEKEARPPAENFDNFGDVRFLFSLIQKNNTEELRSTLPRILDTDSFFKWKLLQLLAGSRHASGLENTRFYFNNALGRFQFIPWDILINQFSTEGVLSQTSIEQALFSLPENELALKKMLWDYVSDEKNLKDDLAFYNSLASDARPAFYRDFLKYDSNAVFDRRIQEHRALIENNFEAIKEYFKKNDSTLVITYDGYSRMVTLDARISAFGGVVFNAMRFLIPPSSFFEGRLYYDTDRDGILDLANDLFLQKKTIGREDTTVVFEAKDIPLFGDDAHKRTDEYTFFVVFSPVENGSAHIPIEDVIVDASIATTGKETKFKDVIVSDITTFSAITDINKTPNEFVRENPKFFLQGSTIVLPSGYYFIEKDIIVPKNAVLTIEAGAVLSFAPGVSLISYSPIKAQGIEWNPVIFQSMYWDEPWGTVGIVDTGNATSTFSFARFQNGRGDYINGISFTGMLAAHYANLELRDSVIETARNDDGVNVKYGTVDILRNTFIRNAFDALDMDYSNGSVAGNTFKENGNDGIDLAGSSVIIENNLISGSGDKCISVGERSENLFIFNNVLDGCKIGIQTKDSSTPFIVNNLIVNNEIGLNAYMKKTIYERGGFPEVYNSIIWGNDAQVVDDGYSKTKIFYSDIEGGFAGVGNFEKKPIFKNTQANSYFLTNSDNIFKNGGSAAALRGLFDMTAGNVPVGLLRDAFTR